MSLARNLLRADAADLGPRAAVHLLNRIGFGPRPGDVARVLDTGLERYIREQLEAPPDPDLDQRLRPLTTLGYPISQVLALYNTDQRSVAQVIDEFYSAKVIRAAHSHNQLLEVMVDFWLNHFNVYIGDGFDRYSTPSYERDAIRPHALGRFRDLLGATAAHPAMLYYLDNYLSTVSRVVNGVLRQGLNENYGRELLELHTVSVDAGYTQEHVFDSARCFTGWGIDNLRDSGRFLYRNQNHDQGTKSVFGLSVPAGGGQHDGEMLLDYLAEHPDTARFVSLKLARRLVADEPPASLVDRAAQTFLSSGGDIRRVLETIIGSREFWAEMLGPGKPKTPLELTISAIRAVDGNVTHARGVGTYVSNMGQPLYQCLPPTGYSNRGADWLNPSSHLYRMNFALDLVSGAVAGVAVDVPAMVRRAGGNPSDARSVADVVNREIFAGQLSRSTLEAAGRATTQGLSVASKAVGLCLAAPEMQAR